VPFVNTISAGVQTAALSLLPPPCSPEQAASKPIAADANSSLLIIKISLYIFQFNLFCYNVHKIKRITAKRQ
jgi:hypothetical protein